MDWDEMQQRMFGGGHVGMGLMGGYGLLLGALLLTVLVVLAVVVVSAVGRGGHDVATTGRGPTTAERSPGEDELEVQYARGQIDAETLARRRAVLRHGR